MMSKEYRVGVAYEEGFVVYVKANSKEQASKKVYDKVDMFGDCVISSRPKYHDKKVVHREWFITDVEEQDDE
jgi:hypothetical protein